MRALHLLFFASALFASSLGMAQNETSTFKVIENLKLPAKAVSSDGRYICGDFKGQAFIHDTETNSTIEIPPTYNEYDVAVLDGLNDINPAGIAVGHWGDNAAYYENNKWHSLPMPSNRGMGSAHSITDDGNIIVGESEVSFLYGPGMPLIWTKEGDGYKLDSLPHPDRDAFGRTIARCGALYISKDGSVIAGRFQDKSFAQFALLIVWKKVNGEWEYTLFGEELIYDKTKPHPGNMPESEDYITAEPDTPEYNAQVEEYNAAIDEFYIKLMGEDNQGGYSKMCMLVTYLGGFDMSANGRYLIGTIKDQLKESSYAYSIDLETASLTTYKDITVGGGSACVGNDGTMFFISMLGLPVQDGTVLLPGAKESMGLAEYFKLRSGIDYSEQIASLNGNAGTPIISADNNTVVCWLGTPDFIAADCNYYVKFAPDAIAKAETDRTSVLSLKNKVLFIMEEVQEALVYDLTGRVIYKGAGREIDMHQWPEGIYLVKVSLKGKTVSEKIILRY